MEELQIKVLWGGGPSSLGSKHSIHGIEKTLNASIRTQLRQAGGGVSHLGHSSLEDNVPEWVGCRTQHGGHQHPDGWPARNRVPGEVDHNLQPLPLVDGDRRNLACGGPDRGGWRDGVQFCCTQPVPNASTKIMEGAEA